MLTLPDELRLVIEKDGTPVPIVDSLTRETYIILRAKVVSDSQNDFTAQIPGIAAYGDGETEQEASVALCEALRGYLEAFADS